MLLLVGGTRNQGWFNATKIIKECGNDDAYPKNHLMLSQKQQFCSAATSAIEAGFQAAGA
ncbi:hypothetical protein DPQ33_03170 [Oceanidesulfovibrio indonesiensis]|uniref:Uncharacterized protein n=1 Tax=Oceanidesulfovibrio indonesiensis TaxID=54767 RepID=A0A7M3MJ04_9BACT|nr:hypothetical protein DPQ33_03170 [Oceanidesulfovibrio indonesiensis]